MSVVDKLIVSPDNEDGTLCPYGLGHMFFESMQKYKNNIAQINVLNGQKDTYSQLLQRCIRTSLELKSRGLTREDIITLNSNNHSDSSVPFIAAQFMGCRIASLDPSIPLQDAKDLLAQVNPRIIFTVSSAEELITEAVDGLARKPDIVVFGSEAFEVFLSPKDDENSFEPVKLDPMETAVILFSSGTTGLPKGICCPHLMLAKAGKTALITMNFNTFLAYSTLFWLSSVIILTECSRNGTARVLVPKFDSAQFWYIAEKFKITSLICAPTQMVQIIKNKPNRQFDMSSFSGILVGGGPVPSSYLDEIKKICPNISTFQVYGQSELGILTKFLFSESHLELMKQKPQSCGVLMPGFTAKVVDTVTNNILGPNEIGEIRIKSIYQMNGYHGKHSKETWDAEGFICTGDLGYYDDNKCFYIVDRTKEMLKYQSWHVTPSKIESILLKHPDVSETVVIGKPHEEDGDHPLALVVLKKNIANSVSPDDLQRYADEQLDDRHKLRGGVIFMNMLLYTPSGKFRRSEMRKNILNGIREF